MGVNGFTPERNEKGLTMEEEMDYKELNEEHIPEGLTPEGRKAAEAIVEVVKKGDDTYLGGCKPFYTPEEWRERGEEYGLESELIVVHDGGDLVCYFNYDYGAYKSVEKMEEALEELGMFAEPCTSWYSAIYHM
jgi:hypothetical protein